MNILIVVLEWLGLAIIAGFIGVLLTIFFTDFIYSIIARFIGGIFPVNARYFKGIWESTYQYESHGKLNTTTQLMVLQRFGSFTFGKSIFGNVHRHQIWGKIRDEFYLTGTWENILPGVRYYGAFQYYLFPDGKLMKGTWVGFGSEHQIKYGHWTWKLLSSDTREKIQKQFVRKYEKKAS